MGSENMHVPLEVVLVDVATAVAVEVDAEAEALDVAEALASFPMEEEAALAVSLEAGATVMGLLSVSSVFDWLPETLATEEAVVETTVEVVVEGDAVVGVGVKAEKPCPLQPPRPLASVA